MLAAGSAFAEDFKSQAAVAAAQWDATFNAGDVVKLSKAYTQDALILPADGPQVTGQVRWLGLSEQRFRFTKWSVCRVQAAALSGSWVK